VAIREGGRIAFHDRLPVITPTTGVGVALQHAGREPGVRRACAEQLKPDQRLVACQVPFLNENDFRPSQAHLPLIPDVNSTVRVYERLPNTAAVDPPSAG
jgi:hypothetical protein